MVCVSLIDGSLQVLPHSSSSRSRSPGRGTDVGLPSPPDPVPVSGRVPVMNQGVWKVGVSRSWMTGSQTRTFLTSGSTEGPTTECSLDYPRHRVLTDTTRVTLGASTDDV